MTYVADDKILMKEWLSEKNDELGLRPEELLVGSGKKAWWKCSTCGHEWLTYIYNRKKGGCAVCAGKKVIPGHNDLATTNPELLREWDYEKNSKLGLTPQNVMSGTRKKAWWKCSTCGCGWMTYIYIRQKHGCPECGFKKLSEDRSHVPHNGKSVTDVFPDAIKCWNYEKNGSLRPEDVAAMSNKKVWWKCSECGKEWQAAAYTRIKHQRTTCKDCSRRNPHRVFLVRGVNDLATKNKAVAQEWNYKKNGSLRPEDVTASSRERVWWECKKGHEWQAKVVTRTKEGYRGCPICSNRFVQQGINDLATTHPDVAKEWNYEKNGDLRPEDVTAGSNKRVWWACEKGHEWQASCNNRCKMNGHTTRCPYCINQRVLAGYNDLATTNPELAKEWNYEKNGDLRPEDVSAGSGKKVWWVCSACGYEWETPISDRSNGHRCPACINRAVIPGVNDLATTNPELAKEWNYEKNGDLRPENIIAGSPKKVWWVCKKGHEWQAVIASRKRGANCPACFANRNTSVSEKAVGYYLEKYGEIIEENKRLDRRELDIYIPGKNIAIEYDGGHYHMDAKKDKAKNKRCFELGIKLIRLREPGLPKLKSTSVDIEIGTIRNDHSHLNGPILRVLEEVLGPGNYDVDLVRDFGAIYARYQKGESRKSLANTHPELLKEWDYEKNEVDPNNIPASSHYRAWWICSTCGKEWQAAVYSRAGMGTGCQICGYKRMGAMNATLKKGQLSLAEQNPALAKEWNYEKNGDLRPEDVAAGSNRKVWWICGKGHEWQASVCNRIKSQGCPVCSNKAVLSGFNDLATINPKLAREWNYEKNGDLRPEDVGAGSKTKAWWKCSTCEHEWEANISDRNKGRGCPLCANKVVRAGFNDLATINPKLAREWNYEKNGDLRPEDVTAKSNKKVWWKCPTCGREWETSVSNRAAGKGCVECNFAKLSQINSTPHDGNRLTDVFPEAIKCWDYEKNGSLRPEDVAAGSNRKVWWICTECGKSWEAPPCSRVTGRTTTCRGCSLKHAHYVKTGINDLATTNPELAKEWNYEKNGDLRPEDVSAGSGKKVWWKCSTCGREWEATVHNRNSGRGCAECAKAKR